MTTDPEARSYYAKILGLNPKGRSQQSALCPFHNDSHKSLSVNLETGLWKCFAGCGSGNRLQVAAKLRGNDGSKGQQPDPEQATVNPEWTPEAIYEFRDANNKPLFRKVRYPKKKFVLEQLGKNGEWRRGLDGVPTRPLYNLPAVMAAKNIVIVEGEKDVDRLTRLLRKARTKNWAATTNFDGAEGPFREEYKEYLTGKNVVIVPDNDEAGRKHAEVFARGASSVAAGVSLLELPDLPDKGDVSDYLAEHPDRDFLRELKKAKPWQDPIQGLFQRAPEFAAQTPEDTPWIVKGLIAEGTVSQLIGKSKSGKSTFTHCMIRAVLQGRDFLNYPATRGPVVYLTEMPEIDLRTQLKGCVGLLEHNDLHLLLWHRAMSLTWPDVAQGAIQRCKLTGAKLLIIDTFSVWTRIEDENSASDTIAAFQPLQRAVLEGIGVFIESHERKSGGELSDAGRGSSALGGLVSTVITLRRPPGNQPPSYRYIESVGRHGQQRFIGNWNGSDYEYLGTKHAVASEQGRKKLIAALRSSEKEALTEKELKEKTGISRSVLQRLLKELMQKGLVLRCGTSKKNNPYRYYLKAF
jgi:hypothetical protein